MCKYLYLCDIYTVRRRDRFFSLIYNTSDSKKRMACATKHHCIWTCIECFDSRHAYIDKPSREEEREGFERGKRTNCYYIKWKNTLFSKWCKVLTNVTVHTQIRLFFETQKSALNMSECLARISQAYVFVASEEIVVLLFVDCGCFNFRHEVSLIIYLLRLSSSVQNNYLSWCDMRSLTQIQNVFCCCHGSCLMYRFMVYRTNVYCARSRYTLIRKLFQLSIVGNEYDAVSNRCMQCFPWYVQCLFIVYFDLSASSTMHENSVLLTQ